jgi:ribulose bisphosphate carboxylase small subunit
MDLTSNSPQKALTILRQLSREKTTMNQLTHFLNISYTLADEFKEIYRRLK